ncbi:MAG: hypothetical protein AUJ60_09485 [Nitrospirae bacterium CG1_02_44_142]|nr:MAG: hypothetical protein AUJ60_09485 [Nitrospirae bacterium CG1_02_44_142]
MALWDTIKEIRIKAGKTQKQFGDMLGGITKTHISTIERPYEQTRTTASDSLLKKIAKTFTETKEDQTTLEKKLIMERAELLLQRMKIPFEFNECFIKIRPVIDLNENIFNEYAGMFDLVFDNIRKPLNIGGIIRLACATGSKLYFTSNSVSYKNRKALLSAVGYENSVDISYERDFRKLIEALKIEGKTIVGTSPASKKLYTEVDYTQPTVFVFGTEACGLSKEKRQLMDEMVYIPMAAEVESLNIVTTAAILTYEGLRQKNFKFVKK